MLISQVIVSFLCIWFSLIIYSRVLPKYGNLANLFWNREVIIFWHVLVTAKLEIKILVLTFMCCNYYSMLFFDLGKYKSFPMKAYWKSYRPTVFSAYWTTLSWLFDKSGCYLLLSDWKQACCFYSFSLSDVLSSHSLLRFVLAPLFTQRRQFPFDYLSDFAINLFRLVLIFLETIAEVIILGFIRLKKSICHKFYDVHIKSYQAPDKVFDVSDLYYYHRFLTSFFNPFCIRFINPSIGD